MLRVVFQKCLGEIFWGEAVISGPVPTTRRALPARFTDIVTSHPEQALKTRWRSEGKEATQSVIILLTIRPQQAASLPVRRNLVQLTSSRTVLSQDLRWKTKTKKCEMRNDDERPRRLNNLDWYDSISPFPKERVHVLLILIVINYFRELFCCLPFDVLCSRELCNDL